MVLLKAQWYQFEELSRHKYLRRTHFLTTIPFKGGEFNDGQYIFQNLPQELDENQTVCADICYTDIKYIRKSHLQREEQSF